MADTAKNVDEAEEASCPEEGHTIVEEQRTEQVEEDDVNCCKVEPDCEELSVSQEQRQAMVISDLASPTVSVISISSDEEEGAQRHSIGEWVLITVLPLIIFLNRLKKKMDVWFLCVSLYTQM